MLLGCFGTVLSLLIVGFSQNFWVALIGRIVGGVLNGNIGMVNSACVEKENVPTDVRQVSFRPWWARLLPSPITNQKHTLSCLLYGQSEQSSVRH